MHLRFRVEFLDMSLDQMRGSVDCDSKAIYLSLRLCHVKTRSEKKQNSQPSKALSTAKDAAEKVATRLWPGFTSQVSASMKGGKLKDTYHHIQLVPNEPS